MLAGSRRVTARILVRKRLLAPGGAAYSTFSSTLILQRDIPAPHCGSIRILLLNNEKSRNAISQALLDELTQHVEAVRSEDSHGQVRALILGSAVDSSFCAGADLKERANFTTIETETFLRKLRSTFASLSALPLPTITAVSSLALGGGLELALCSHFRVFASTATVGLPESRLAILPGAGGTYRLPALIGRTRALDMMLTGRRVGAAEAYFLGICDRMVPVEPADHAEHGIGTSDRAGEAKLLNAANKLTLESATALAREICEGGPIALRMILSTIAGQRLSENPERGALLEDESYRNVVKTEDRNEALQAFKEKRKPVFKGR